MKRSSSAHELPAVRLVPLRLRTLPLPVVDSCLRLIAGLSFDISARRAEAFGVMRDAEALADETRRLPACTGRGGAVAITSPTALGVTGPSA